MTRAKRNKGHRPSKLKRARKAKPKFKQWRVTFEVQRVKVYEPKEKIRTAEEAEQRARDEVLFDDEPMLDRDEITSITTRWVDKMDVEHVATCPGNHCKHYGCQEPDDDVPWYCTQCDPASYQ